jgi:peptidoglycan hydrolase-like protein with peptidoglycan-binding domain
VRYSAILLAGVMTVGACVPYATDAPPLSGSVQYGPVRDVQGGLQQLGYYDGALDGVNGAQTQQAILRYQSDQGLRRDGLIDNDLILRINADVNAGAYPGTVGPSAQTIGQVQASLNDLGYYSGRADGQIDRDTRAAIISYRRDRGLPVTDAIDQQLIGALRRDLAAAPSPVADQASDRFESGYTLPAGARAVLDRRWRSYEGMLVDLDQDGALDVIARAGQFSDDCRGGDCGYVVLENRRGVYTEISAFAASETRVLGRSTNGFSDIGYRMAGTSQGSVLRFDGSRYRI